MSRLACLVGLLAVALAAGAQTRDRTLVVAPTQAVAGEARHALVVGNSAYANGPLRNPVNDARAMANALGEAGFTVHLLEDASQAAMQRAVRTFGNQIAKGGVGLFYYAGHGLQAKGRNYLVPVNAEIAQEDEIEFGSVDVNLVLAKMDSAKNALNIVILDACRNNPFARSFRSTQVGLAQMDAPTGTFIAFATAPGSVAADGAGEHGIYTKHLLAEMSRPGMPIEQLFKQVRIGVMAETKGRQIPWESSSLRGEFAFRPGAQPSVAEAVAEAIRRDREVQQRDMEKLIQAALDRQRKQLEELGLRLPPSAAPKPPAVESVSAVAAVTPAATVPAPQSVPHAPVASPPVPQPVPHTVTASVAPAVAAASSRLRSLPREGDTFTYQLLQPDRRDQQKFAYTVTVKAVTAQAILEQIAVPGITPIEWAHTEGTYVVNLGVSVYSPYLAAFGQIGAGTKLGSTTNLDHSTCLTGWTCRLNALIAARERIQVPAGVFDTIKVQLEQNWSGGTAWWPSLGGRTLTIWYSPEVKRALKFSNREWISGGGNVTGNFDLELVSYESK